MTFDLLFTSDLLHFYFDFNYLFYLQKYLFSFSFFILFYKFFGNKKKIFSLKIDHITF